MADTAVAWVGLPLVRFCLVKQPRRKTIRVLRHFIANTMGESDFLRPPIIGLRVRPCRCGTLRNDFPDDQPEDLPIPE